MLKSLSSKSTARFERRADLLSRLGIGRSQSYLMEEKGLLPPPVRLTERSVGWPSDEIDLLVDARIAGDSDQVIRQLVTEMVEMRKCRRRSGPQLEPCSNSPCAPVARKGVTP